MLRFSQTHRSAENGRSCIRSQPIEKDINLTGHEEEMIEDKLGG